MVEVTFPNGDKKTFEKNTDGLEVAKSISNEFSKTCVAFKLDDKIMDVSEKISNNASIRFITTKDPEALPIMRHTAAHIMAQAIVKLFPNAKLTVGPVTKDGFYYDIDMNSLSEDSFPKIEMEIKKIINSKIPITRKEVSKKKALKIYKNEPYKVELISAIKDTEIVSIYEQGDFMDLCRGPHLPHTGFVKAIKLMRVSGAYWRSDQSKPQLQRIYGTAFFSKKNLDDYIRLLKESDRRNHRKISTEMGLISFHNDSPGMPIFHPKGMIIWNALLEYWREEHRKSGYQEIKTPTILRRNLWEKSGHWENYKNNMYTTEIDNETFVLKPMNCPGTMVYYKTRPRSYKELPMKIAEIGLVHRHELSGVLSGLFRVRAFHQDDAHIFMKQKQVSDEIYQLLQLENKICKTFGLGYKLELSTRPDKFIGTEKQWELTTNYLELALEAHGKEFKVNKNGGAFYGPKIDFHIEDALGRTWQCGTIQLDMSLPERFDLNFIDRDNKKRRPVVLHRAIFGSIERFFGILVEHFAGKFPLWLTPIQIMVLPLNKDMVFPSKTFAKKIEALGLRVKVNTSSESFNKKVRKAQIDNIPLILTYGPKENSSGSLSVRTLNGRISKNTTLESFTKTVHEHISQKKLSLDIFKQ